MKPMFTIAAFAICATSALPALAASRQVFGTVRYEDALNGTFAATRAIRSVQINVKVGGTTVGTATTNSSGSYSVWIDESKLPPGQTMKIEYISKNFASDVQLDLDWENDRLYFASTRSIPSGLTPIQLDDTVTIAEFAQHFSILDAIHRGRSYADARREGGDDIGQVSVQYPDADWTNYNDFWGEITVAGASAYGYGGNATDHGWNDGVILHEYGHHLEYDISDVNTGGGEHTSCTDNGYGFAWSEGWATYFASTVGNTYAGLLLDFSNIEPISSCAAPAAEAHTRSVLWDLYDGVGSGSDAHDRVNGASYSGAKPIRDIMFGIFDTEQDDVTCQWVGQSYYCTDPTTSILSFHNHWVNRSLYTGAHADIDRVLAAHGIYPHALSDYSVASITRSPSGSVVTGTNLQLTLGLYNAGAAAYADEDLRVRVTIWPSGSSEIELANFTTTTFTGSKNVVRNVTLPSSVPQGSHALFVYVDPLDRFPESIENNGVLAVIVPVLACGNGTCSAGETCSSCAADCGSCCGNGFCSYNESCSSCPSDCGACGGCGDGYCTGNETPFNCAADCGDDDPGTCFVAGTPITMADGTTKPIEEVREGDQVTSFDPISKLLVQGRVVRTFVHDEAERLVVINDDLVTTMDHRFWSASDWIPASDLDAGSDLLVLPASLPAAQLAPVPGAVRQIASREGRVTTYNFEVEGWHNYFAGGVLVHNIKYDP